MTSFRDVYDQVIEADGQLLGISGDHVWAHKAFAKSLGGLPFPLLADWGMAVTRRYGIHNPERDAPTRSAFVIDREGTIRMVNPGFDARDPGHYAQVLEELAALP
ncbi:MAG: redoxin domain-containing protein [Chloroflexi bacterium]|nr:redoxin domain-containing protein [Chloroflexota bacterium]